MVRVLSYWFSSPRGVSQEACRVVSEKANKHTTQAEEVRGGGGEEIQPDG